MTELFRAVQETLRAHKEKGIDLTHPMGVEIFGKLYPALEKGVMVHEYHDGFRNPSKASPENEGDKDNTAFYTIPFESGLKVSGYSGYSASRLSAGDTHFTHHKLWQPGINVSESHPTSRYTWEQATGTDNKHHVYSDALHLPEKQKEFHETMVNWSSMRAEGFTHANGEHHQVMTDDEHREHQRNLPIKKRPHEMTVVHRTLSARREPFLIYKYDLRTEQLSLDTFKYV